MAQYAVAEISIRRREAQGYPVELRFFDLMQNERQFPKNDKVYAALELQELRLEGPEKQGQELGKALFGFSIGPGEARLNEIGQGLNIARAIVESEAEAVLRVKLYIAPEAEELHALPWETLCDLDGNRLFEGTRMLFSRYLNSDHISTQKRSRGRAEARALIVVANCVGIAELPPVMVADELKRAREGFRLAGIECTALATGEAESLGPASAESILNQMDRGYDILYLVCHGVQTDDGESFLILEEGVVDAGKLVERIRKAQEQPRLVILASCESAGQTGSTPSGLGPKLVEAGIPAVIAMQGKVLMETIAKFMPVFLSELVKGNGQIERAMGVARERTASAGHTDYWMPALFSRLVTGQLWGTLLQDGERENPENLFNVPERPAGFVARPMLAGSIKNLLIAGKNALIQGAGGFGKTTLAIDACRDEGVAEAYPGGVVWTSLGTKPDLGQVLSDLYFLVSGKKSEAAGLQQLQHAFASTVEGRGVLIVVDDAWRAQDLHPFLQLKGTTLLVTTRNPALIQEAGQSGWSEVAVDQMEDEEAVRFLIQDLGIDGEIPKEFQSLAKELGGWPLLLELARARLIEEKKHGRGIEFVVKLFQKKGVLGFDLRNSDSRNSAVARSVEVGLDWAEEMFPGLSQKACEISIFPENVAIPVRVLQDLFGMDEIDLEEEVLRPLDQVSLVRWNRTAQETSLHMMVDRALEERLKQSEGGAPALHRKLIEAWGDPCNLKYEYAWRWFGWHCKQAGDLERLRGLLLDFRWLRAKLEATDINRLLSEFELIQGDPKLQMLEGVLRISAHVLAVDKSQLAGQLLGRIPEEERTLRAGILEAALASGGRWLRPLRPSLTAPGRGLIRKLAGHTAGIADAAMTPDGMHVISASYDGTLKVWSLMSGEAVRTLSSHGKPVYGVAVSPDGKQVVSALDDGRLKLWDLASGIEVCTFEGHNDYVARVEFTPDGRSVVSASNDGTLKVWELDHGKAILTLDGHEGGAYCLKVSPDGKRVISAGADKTLKAWELASGACLWTMATTSDSDTNGYVRDLTTGRDGLFVVSASVDHCFRVWDIASGVEVSTLQGPFGVGFAVSCTPDGKHVAVALMTGEIELYDLNTGASLGTLGHHNGILTRIVVTPNGENAVSASDDGTLVVWDLTTRIKAPVAMEDKGNVVCMASSLDGSLVVAKHMFDQIEAWDLPSGESRWRAAGHHSEVKGVAITQDGMKAVSASMDLSLKVWDLTTGDELRTLRGHSMVVHAVATTPNGRQAISASDDGTLKIWDLDSGEMLRTLEGHSGGVTDVAVTPDGSCAVSTSYDHTLKIWNLDRGKLVLTLHGHLDSVVSVAITNDGTRAVSASSDHTLKVWDLKNGQMLRNLSGHSDWVGSVAITPDDQHVISVSSDKTLRVWELASGEVIRTHVGDWQLSQKVVVTADGRRVVSASLGKTVDVFDLETCDLLQAFRGHTGWVYDVALHPDGQQAVSASKDGTLRVWSLTDGAPAVGVLGDAGTVTSLKLSADAEKLISASTDGLIRVRSIGTGIKLKTVGRPSYHRAESDHALAVTLDGTRVVVAEPINGIRVWNLDDGSRVDVEFEGHSGPVRGIDASPDGKVLVSASEDKTLKVWDLASGIELSTLAGHESGVDCVAVTLDGKHAVSGSYDKTIKVWDLAIGKEIRSLAGHSGHIWSVALTRDGKRIVSAASEGSIKLWDLASGQCLATYSGDRASRCCAVAGSRNIVAGQEGGAIHYLSLEGLGRYE